MINKNLSLQELAESKGKKLLIENFTVDFKSFPKNNLVQFDKPRLVESNGQQFQCRGILRAVPVTKFTENLNGRIYPRQLWERVQVERMFEQGLCLADHAPDGSSGSVQNRVGIWHNFKVIENYGIADLYCIGRLGQELLESVAAGGKEGFSTVGFGELEEDKKTVNPNTFECAPNPCDNVIGPSQEVYATFENLSSLSLNTESIVNSSTNNSKQSELKESVLVVKENTTMPEATLTKIEESHFRNMAHQAIKEARRAIKECDLEKLSEVQENLKQTLSQLPEVLKEERGKLDQTAIEVYDTLVEQSAATKNALREQTATGEELQTKLQTMEVTLQKLRDDNQKLLEVQDDFKKLLTDANLSEKDRTQLEEDNSNRQKDLDVMMGVIQECFSVISKGGEFPESAEELVTKLQEYTNILRDNQDNMQSDINVYSQQLRKAHQVREAMQADLNIAVEKLKEAGYQFSQPDMGPGYQFANMQGNYMAGGVGQDNYSGFGNGSSYRGIGSAMNGGEWKDEDEDEYMGMVGDVPGDMAYGGGSPGYDNSQMDVSGDMAYGMNYYMNPNMYGEANNQLGPHKDMQSGFSGPAGNPDTGYGMNGEEPDMEGVGSAMKGYGAQSGDGVLNKFGPHSDMQSGFSGPPNTPDKGYGMRRENRSSFNRRRYQEGSPEGSGQVPGMFGNQQQPGVALDPALSAMDQAFGTEYPDNQITESRKQIALKEQVKRSIHQYYVQESTKNPALRSIQQRIMASKSLIEAVKIVETFNKNEKDQVIRTRYNETRSNNNSGDWLGKYR